MSVREVLKNICSFAQILGQAGSRKASTWDEQSLRNALQWARYCEQVHHQSDGKHFKDDLDKQIRLLIPLLAQPLCVKLSLETLGGAVSLLTQVLLQNEYLQKDLFQKLVDDLLKDSKQDFLVQVCCQKASTEASLRVVRNLKILLSRTEPDSGELAGSLLKNQVRQSEAELLMEQFLQQASCIQKPNRLKEKIKSFLFDLTQSVAGWETILELLVCSGVDISGSSPVAVLQLRDIILDFVLHNITPESTCSVWLADQQLLAKVAESQFPFFSVYLSHLVQQARHLSKNSRCSSHPCSQICVVEDRAVQNEDRIFQVLVSHFQGLCWGGKKLSRAVHVTLESLQQTEDTGVWYDIVKHLKK